MSQQKVIDKEQEEKLHNIRHSMAHVTAAAVKKLFPEAKFGIGPVIENGFYYDFDLSKTLTPQDIKKIEKEARKLLRQDSTFERIEAKSPEEAIKIVEGQDFKIELIEELLETDDTITFYKVGDFLDLCRGGHVEKTLDINPDAFKLSHVSGAYWRGNEKNKMLQRIYGVGFETKEELDSHLAMLEEAKKRDHRKIGAEMDLFSMHNEGPGMPFFHPRGKAMYKELVKFTREKLFEYDYDEVQAPNMLDCSLWKQSGHWDHYKDEMYFIESEERTYALRPMDCPGTILIYKNSPHSYKDLPLRWAETGTVTRKERSGVLNGLFRVVQITQDDAHIFVTPEQIHQEISSLLKLIDDTYRAFGLSYSINLSTRPENYMGELKVWDAAEASLKKALKENDRDYCLNEGDGAFYGPKLDFWIKDSLGRDWQCATVQLDFQMPNQFELDYIGNDGKKHPPVILHRTIMGSYERFLGILIEHYAGNFPTWLAPVHVALLPVADRHFEFAESLRKEFREAGIRVDVDNSLETVGNKIRKSSKQKYPYSLVLGDKEMESGNLAIRERGKKDVTELSREQFIQRVQSEILERK